MIASLPVAKLNLNPQILVQVPRGPGEGTASPGTQDKLKATPIPVTTCPDVSEQKVNVCGRAGTGALDKRLRHRAGGGWKGSCSSFPGERVRGAPMWQPRWCQGENELVTLRPCPQGCQGPQAAEGNAGQKGGAAWLELGDGPHAARSEHCFETKLLVPPHQDRNPQDPAPKRPPGAPP